jgi:hypothetical protein
LAMSDEVERAHRAIVRGERIARRPRMPRRLSVPRSARTIAGE